MADSRRKDHRQRVELLEDSILQLGGRLLDEGARDGRRGAEHAARLVDVVLQQPVVEHRAVVDVGERRVGDRRLEQAAEHVLELGGPLEEELDGGGEEAEADQRRLLLGELVDHRLEQVRRLGDLLAILGKHPQQRHLGVILGEGVRYGEGAEC